MKKNGIKKLTAAAVSTAMVFSLSAVFSADVAIAETGTDVIFSADFEDGSTAGFSKRGDTDTSVLTVTEETAHGGSKALQVSERSSSWNGPSIPLDNLIETQTTYIISLSAKTLWYCSLTLSLQYNDADGQVHYQNVTSQTCQGDWVDFTDVKFSFPDGSTDMSVYVEGSDAGADIYLDDVVIKNAPEVAIEDIASVCDAYSQYFKVGTAIMASDLSSKPTMKLVEKHFNKSITAGNEMKPDSVLDKAASAAMAESGDDTNPQVTFASAKPILDYCSKNNIPVRVHTLVWHSQTPDWFFKENYDDNGEWVSKEKMLVRMENYIKNYFETLTSLYPDIDFYACDVVNEAWTDGGVPRTAGSNNETTGNSAWVKVFGDNSFIEPAFTYARKYAPEGCKLYYNDYNEYIDQKTKAIVNMANDLKEKGLIDGIGMQSHLDVGFPAASQYKNALKQFVDTGLDVQVTELDITTSDTSEAGLEKQAEVYSDIMDAIVEYSDSISAVIFWGITDDASWRASQIPLIFDGNYTAKPAYYAIMDGIEIPETTEPSTEITEPTTEITEPSTEITEPTTEVTEPSTEITEPTTEITEPSTEITEPTTEVTEPSTEIGTVESDPTVSEELPEVSMYGDVNVDTKVNVADVILLNKYIVGADTITDQGLANAECYLDGKTDVNDSAQIMNVVVMTLGQDQLPVNP